MSSDDPVIHKSKTETESEKSQARTDRSRSGTTNSALARHDEHPPIEPGTIVGGRYKVLDFLGRGGMGSVYLVEHALTRKRYAMKTLDAKNVPDVSWQRFQQEAKAATRLDHIGLVQAHDFGVSEDQQPFFVMDFCPGQTLAEILMENGPIPLNAALDLFIQICFALGYAHDKKIIHRDIKPSNIIVSEQDGKKTCKIVDFGIAKLASADEESIMTLTKTGEVFGTPFYMSPEQSLGLALDHRSDIYSLGCVFFEVLTGMPPFFCDTALATLMKHQNEKPPTLKEASLGQSFPDGIEAIISKMLSKNPAERYQNLLDVAQELSLFQTNRLPGAHGGSATKQLAKVERQVSDAEIKAGLIGAALSAVVTITIGWFAVQAHIDITAIANGSFFKDPAAKPAPSNTVPATVTAKTDATTNGSADEGLAGAAGLLKEIPVDYYSRESDLNESTRHFTFPAEPSGLMVSSLESGSHLLKLDKEKGSLVKAEKLVRGDVQITDFHPISLTVAETACQNPIFLRWFRPDEVASLQFDQGSSATSQCLAAIKHYRALKALSLAQAKINDQDLAIVNAMPLLEELDVSGTKVTADALAKLTRLHDLRALKADNIANAGSILRTPAAFSNLEVLSLAGDNVTDEDLEALGAGKLLALKTLVLKDNKKVSDRGIASLLPLPNLIEIDLVNCQISPGVLPTLKQMPKLKLPRIGPKPFPLAQQQELLMFTQSHQ